MHGLGNDFVIIDERRCPMQIVEEAQRIREVRAIADRRHGVGCDQLVVLRPSRRADTYMQIYNADGGEVSACGNATRCVAWLMMREGRKDAALVETAAGLLECRLDATGQVRVNMGMPKLSWLEIPLAEARDTLRLDVEYGALHAPVAVNVGNPHLVFFVSDAESVPLAEAGPALEHHPLFPERVNVNIAQVDAPARMILRTWERGAGETLACGTGACATVVAARRRGLAEPNVIVRLPGGTLTIHWEGSEEDPAHPVWMTGTVAHAFSGALPESAWV
jgi:diaminopimelate epimerase